MQTQRMTRKQMVDHLRQHGYPIGDSTIDKLCAPTVNEGPPVAAWWGRRPLYDPDEALAWAEKRTRPPGLVDALESTASKPDPGDVREGMATKPCPAGDVPVRRAARARSDHS
jgi:hypothetical protein